MKLKLYAVGVIAALTWSAPALATPIAPIGTTDVTVSDFFLGVLTESSIAASPIEGASASGIVVSFDITGGTTDPLVIDHSGGVLFTKDSDSLSATNFVIDGVLETVSANVNGGADFVPIFTLGNVDASGPITADLIINRILAQAISDTFFDSDVSGLLVGEVFGFASTSPTPVPVPVPVPAALLIAGLGSLAALRRRKASA